jgi:2-polyprenyl-3-methyl-5-hydroxy-6-metoxy-1,4-benzoquinol methylase/flagellar biosynthesis chaperone FliJ
MELTNGKNNLFFSHGQDAENKYYHSVYIYNDISSLYLLSEKIPPNSVVIDLACGSGKLGFVINNEKKPCELYGVEMDVTAAKCAAEPGFYKNIFIFDLTNYECIEYSKMLQVVASPDVIVMSDILEHLADPTVVLLHYLKILKEDGIILISVPNVAHADIGLGLLEGKFNYTQMGILDNTHLKFFTRSSFFEWIELIKKQYSINIQCEFLGTTVIDTDYLNSIRLNHSELFESLILNPDFNALQLLFLIRKANDETDKDNIGNNDFRKPMESIVETISGKLKGFNPLAGNNEIGKISDNERLMYEKRITALYTNQNNRVLSFTNQVKRLEDNIQNTKTTLTQRNEQIKELKDKKNALSSNVSRLENIITIRNERIDALLAYVSQLENTVNEIQNTSLWKLFIKRIINR